MSTSKDYLNFVLDQLSEVEGITHRQMMGEYIIYMQGKIAAYLCDDRLFVKPTPSAVKMLPEAEKRPPYEGAKDMLLVECVDDRQSLKALFEAVYSELPTPRNK